MHNRTWRKSSRTPGTFPIKNLLEMREIQLLPQWNGQFGLRVKVSDEVIICQIRILLLPPGRNSINTMQSTSVRRHNKMCSLFCFCLFCKACSRTRFCFENNNKNFQFRRFNHKRAKRHESAQVRRRVCSKLLRQLAFTRRDRLYAVNEYASSFCTKAMCFCVCEWYYGICVHI